MSRTSNTGSDLKRQMTTMNAYVRVLGLRTSFSRLRPENLTDGAHAAITSGVNGLVNALEKSLPPDMVRLARGETSKSSK